MRISNKKAKLLAEKLYIKQKSEYCKARNKAIALTKKEIKNAKDWATLLIKAPAYVKEGLFKRTDLSQQITYNTIYLNMMRKKDEIFKSKYPHVQAINIMVDRIKSVAINVKNISELKKHFNL